MTFAPTPEQVAVVDAARNTSYNLIIDALAGAAKTSTLVLLAQALPDTRILCLAFNKRIATEMQERLPPNCHAMTLNSLGHRVWGEVLSKRLILEKDKSFFLLTEAVKALPKFAQEEAYTDFADILKEIEQGKSAGWIPDGHFKNAKGLLDDAEFFGGLEERPSSVRINLLRDVTVRSIEKGLAGVIDFSDQIMLPTVFPSMFPHYPLVMVDEAQDLSALNHATLRKLARRRLIAVGDPNQAIYGFRGAHEDSMSLLRSSFKMRPLQLTVSFRCPKAVVTEAQWRAPHMRYPEWAKEGSVRTLTTWSIGDVPDQAAIICRNNAPLFGMAIKLLKNGRYPQLLGNDIGKYLVKVLKKFGKPSLERPLVYAAIEDWKNEKLAKSRNPGKVNDQAICLRIFADQGNTLGDAIAYAEHLFNSQGPIQLMTGHKSKGLEFDTVFFLDEDLINKEDAQERNLRYVIQTRAKQELIYVKSADFNDPMDEGDNQ